MATASLNWALTRAFQRVDGVSADEQIELLGRLEPLWYKTRDVLRALRPVGDVAAANRVLLALGAKVARMQEMLFVVEAIPPALPGSSLKGARPIPFIDPNVDHDLWPLTGAHIETECDACHVEGLYAGTTGVCSDCHELPEDELYAEHFAGPCEDCHDADDWEPTAFDHVGTVECLSCHAQDEPGYHYVVGVCGNCHDDVEDWAGITYDHADVNACWACHVGDSPEDHYVHSQQDDQAESGMLLVAYAANQDGSAQPATGVSQDLHELPL